MCVIAVKCKGSDFAPLDAIKQCIQKNPDGFAFAWNQDGELKTFRTMDPSEALSKYKQLTETLNPQETAMLFHARWATHGSKAEKNCHCWTHGNIAFAHNGVLSIDAHDDMTDSETFFRDLFVPAMEGCGFEFAMRMSKAFIGRTSNKFAVIDNEGHVSFVSAQGVSYTKVQFPGLRGKIYFSNTLWMPKSTFSSAIGFNPYKDVSKAASPSSNHVSLSGSRQQVAPLQPLSVRRDSPELDAFVESLFGEKYNSVTT